MEDNLLTIERTNVACKCVTKQTKKQGWSRKRRCISWCTKVIQFSMNSFVVNMSRSKQKNWENYLITFIMTILFRNKKSNHCMIIRTHLKNNSLQWTLHYRNFFYQQLVFCNYVFLQNNMLCNIWTNKRNKAKRSELKKYAIIHVKVWFYVDKCDWLYENRTLYSFLLTIFHQNNIILLERQDLIIVLCEILTWLLDNIVRSYIVLSFLDS